MTGHVSVCLIIIQLFVFAQTAEAELSDNIETWNTVPGVPKRIWSRQQLEPAYANKGGMYHAKRLLYKLNSGKRIVSIALGSSFVQDYAGCFHTSIAAVYELGVQPNPHFYPQHEQHGRTCDSAGGYMHAFMDTLNKTWPNVQHIFLNNGKAGSNLEYLVQVDLVLLDTVTGMGHESATEHLLRQFLASPSEPLVVLLSNTRNCEHLEAGLPDIPDPRLTCSQDCLLLHNTSACNALGPEPYTPAANHALEAHRAKHNNLAAHYGMPHINLHHLLARSFLTQELCQQLNVTKWQMLARFYMDAVHFQLCHGYDKPEAFGVAGAAALREPGRRFECTAGMGSLLVADVLVNWLVKMQTALANLPQEERAALETYQLPTAIHAEATKTYNSACVGTPFELAKHASATAAAANRSSSSSSSSMAASTSNAAGTVSLGSATVVRAEGFTAQTYYRGSSGQSKYKPGYLASSAGALLEFELQVELAEASPDKVAEVVISYTTSYDGWGKARISCVHGCTCTPVVVEAAVTEPHSMLASVAVPVMWSHQCRMAVSVLQETSSQGHKFKVSAVTVRASN